MVQCPEDDNCENDIEELPPQCPSHAEGPAALDVVANIAVFEDTDRKDYVEICFLEASVGYAADRKVSSFFLN